MAADHRSSTTDGTDATTARSGTAALLQTLQLSTDRVPAHAERAAGFTRFAADAAKGDITAPPALLTGRRRRLHIRNTVLEDHRVRLHVAPDAVAEKMELLAADAFSFFRGTALLYYRDLVGEDAWLQTVPSVGDVHPENFGVIPGSDGRPLFSANDFDEAWTAPFSWDVRRGAVGFALLARSRELPEKKWWKLADEFVRGYASGVEECLADPAAVETGVTADNAPACLEPFFTRALRTRESFLSDRIDMETLRFLETGRVTRRPGTAGIVRPLVDRYVHSLGRTDLPADFFRIHDVATRTGSGTASLGLPRFWILVEGHGPGAAEKVILEFKASRRSALQGLVPKGAGVTLTPAERTALAFRTFVADGDPLYGHLNLAGLTFLARERGPMKVNVDTSSFRWKELREYARVCGTRTALLHGRFGAAEAAEEAEAAGTTGSARATGRGRYRGSEAMREIAGQVRREVFLADTAEFVEETVARILDDHRMFREDVARGAFRPVTPVPSR